MKLAKLVLQTAKYNELKKFYGEVLELPFDEIKDDCFVIHIHD
jgi:predicted enzyme related to lactoylglutathione lyase